MYVYIFSFIHKIHSFIHCIDMFLYKVNSWIFFILIFGNNIDCRIIVIMYILKDSKILANTN